MGIVINGQAVGFCADDGFDGCLRDQVGGVALVVVGGVILVPIVAAVADVGEIIERPVVMRWNGPNSSTFFLASAVALSASCLVR